MEAVSNREMGVNRAALQHGVPKTTLKDRISVQVQHGTKSGPASYLSHEEEEQCLSS